MVIIRVELKKKGKVSTGGMLNLLKGISVAWTPLFKLYINVRDARWGLVKRCPAVLTNYPYLAL